MLMTPALGFFYGGLVRRKNVAVSDARFMLVGVISVQWVLFGYSLLSRRSRGFIGGLSWVGLHGVGLAPNADYVGDRAAPALYGVSR